ncbi:hypothetical protein [Anaerotruncus rubiinfantis]|uniref:hypothetical protein n=1 Tax=Anaerotruncus rubiinfantis TaxID=1720200 RepID=UPI00189AFEDB|nr:hypothetical protein [Anaerotruncus rubiinfantis]
MKRHAGLKRGTIYTNKGGGKFLCTSDTCNDITYFENVVSGWRLAAHCVTQYDDGTIEWDYSTGGMFAERREN